MRTGRTKSPGRATEGGYATAEHVGSWWRRNRSIRWCGLLALAGTKLAAVVTTAVGIRHISGIVEANPTPRWVFIETGPFSGLGFLGVTTMRSAACAAELHSIEIRRRFGLPKAALVAQASIYLTHSAIVGIIARYNAALIADQATHMINDVVSMPDGLD